MRNKKELHKENIYHIRVEGTLDEKWADWFEGFVMVTRTKGETLLSGEVVDQAALQGILNKIHGLGLPLLLVAQTGCPCPSKNCPRHGKCHQCAAHYGNNGKTPFCFRERTKWDKRRAAFMETR